MRTIREDYNQLILPTYAPPAPVFIRGAGSRVWDEQGRDYVDFGGGIAVLSLGHCPPALVAAISEQSAQLMHLSNLHVNAEAVNLARMLVDHTFAERVFLSNSGTEANEAAIKLARRHGVLAVADKYHILSFSGSFHGRVGMAMAATEPMKVRDGFGPLTPGFRFAPFNDLSAAAVQMDDTVCAIIVEPVQGEGGIQIATADFLRGLRALADKHNALLIYDEVQSGAGRTGALYAYMNGDVIPDLLTSAKGLGGGFPVAATLVGHQVVAALPLGSHGTTYGGNALAARAAHTVMSALLADGFLAGVKERAQQFTHHLQTIQSNYHCFSEIRQAGLWIGCDMASGWRLADVVAAALDAGLIIITAATNTLRFAPALNIPLIDVEEGFQRFQQALDNLKQQQKP